MQPLAVRDASETHDRARPLITVLIPTRNRRRRVAPLVRNLLAYWPKEARDLVEIVVLNNASTDGTAEALEAINSDILRIINREAFLPTSEENIFSGVQYARGEYIWFLGDDDIPRFEGLKNLIELTRARAADFFVFNFRVVDDDGRVASLSQIRGAPCDYEGGVTDIIKRVGLINMLSGWSILVARREMLDVDAAYDIRDVSPIYSHCFWFLKCFRDARCRFVATPLVDYRVFHHTGGWSKYTKENGVGYLYYWHVGLLKLYQWALNDGLLTPEDISKIYEYRHNGTKYRGIDEIAFKLIEQAEAYVTFKSKRELLSRADFAFAVEILVTIDLSILDVCLKIEKIYETLWGRSISNEENLEKYKTAKKNAEQLLWSRTADLFNPFFVELIYGYCVYHYNDTWIGIRCDALSFVDAVFSQLMPQAMEPGVLVASSRVRLMRRLGEMPEVAEPVGERPLLSDVSMFQNPVTAGAGGVLTQGPDGGGKPVATWEDMIAERDARVQELTQMVGDRDQIAVRLNETLIAREKEVAELKRGGMWGLGRAVYRRLRPVPPAPPAVAVAAPKSTPDTAGEPSPPTERSVQASLKGSDAGRPPTGGAAGAASASSGTSALAPPESRL